MNKKSFFVYLTTILVLVIFVVIKQHAIVKNNEKPAITFYSNLEKEGLPAQVLEAKKVNVSNTWKMTLSLEKENIYLGYVPKTLKNSLSKDMPITLHFFEKDAWGKVLSVGSSLNCETGMYPVRILLNEKNMTQNEKIVAEFSLLGEKKDVVILPLEAVQTEEGKAYVWILKEGKAHKQSVTIGERNTNGIIIQGIEEKELFILPSFMPIEENDLIKIN